MNTHRSAKSILGGALLAILFLFGCPVAKAAGEDSAQVSDLLSQSKQEAIRLREDARQMQDFAQTQVTWDTHAVYATKISQDVVAMLDVVDRLGKARSMGSTWQQTAIDRIKPLMAELAASTTTVAETMVKQPFDRTEYNSYLEANYDNASHLADLISDFVDYGKTKQRLEKSAEKLKLNTNSKAK